MILSLYYIGKGFNYESIHKSIKKLRKCELSQERFILNKDLKLNKLSISCYYKNTGVINFINSMLERIEQKLNAK